MNYKRNVKFYLTYPLLGYLLGVGLSASAQVVTVGNPPTPRQAGIGYAGAALTGDAAAVWFNPAGLAEVDQLQAFATYQRPYNLPFFLDLGLGAAYATPRWGTMALSAQSFSVRYQGEDLSAERTVSFSHGFYLQKDLHSSLAVGYTLRLMNWDLGTSVSGMELGSDFAGGLDLGVVGMIWERTRVGGAIRNLNAPTVGSVQKHELPRMVELGLTYEPYRGVLAALGAEKVLGGQMRLKGGLEMIVSAPIRLRAGAFSEPNSFTLGFGLHHQGLGFDYAFVSHPTLEGSHLVGIGFKP
jgi:hypothetical protein